MGFCLGRASADPRFREHPGLHIYGIESYIVVLLKRRDGNSFGTLCTLDPLPASLSDAGFEVFNLLGMVQMRST
jgi:GAF domain-containing protein